MRGIVHRSIGHKAERSRSALRGDRPCGCRRKRAHRDEGAVRCDVGRNVGDEAPLSLAPRSEVETGQRRFQGDGRDRLGLGPASGRHQVRSAITVRGNDCERADGTDAEQQVRQFGTEQVRSCRLIEQRSGARRGDVRPFAGSRVHGPGQGRGLGRLNLGGRSRVADAHEHAPAALEAWRSGIDVAEAASRSCSPDCTPPQVPTTGQFVRARLPGSPRSGLEVPCAPRLGAQKAQKHLEEVTDLFRKLQAGRQAPWRLLRGHLPTLASSVSGSSRASGMTDRGSRVVNCSIN
jgi:hypothetical protein